MKNKKTYRHQQGKIVVDGRTERMKEERTDRGKAVCPSAKARA